MPGGKNNKGGQGGQGGKGGPQKGEDFKFDFGGNKAGGLSKEAQAELLPVLQQKLDTLIGKSSGYFESLPKSVQIKVQALKHLQAKADDFDTEYRKEVAALEEKYKNLKDPLLNRRADIVSGSEPTEDELSSVKPEEKIEIKSEEKKEEVKGIPEFWLGAMSHHPQFAEMIMENDRPILAHLKDIKVSNVEGEEAGSPSFVLEFHFAPNEYFTEEVLKKTYYLKEDHELHEVIFDSVKATEINWKEGKNVTVKLVQKQQKVGGGGRNRGGKNRGGNKGQVKTITVEEPCESFFNFFSPPDEETFLDEDGEGEEELQALLEEDYEIGLMLKTMLIPNAINWFTGDVDLEAFGGFADDEDGDDDEEGEGGEDEEYDSEEDDDFDPKSLPQHQGKGPKGQAGGQQECKQQ
eukprot:TRINITY_DN288_c0_g1_i5.p3 TRINITY_DN288_c0_g1~~TRINITY_DN288_c0_g1_i5.p3  ORF type:complete len:407 (-),score=169.52 TRINITY_DN288_c0_g1_i5:33-1253(-)